MKIVTDPNRPSLASQALQEDLASWTKFSEVDLSPLLERLWEVSPFYRERFRNLNLQPEDIAGIRDFNKLPFTTKSDLRASYPFKMLAVPRDHLSRIHASSGTTGKPTVVGYTKKDLFLWSELIERMYQMSGLTPGMLLQNSYGYGLTTGGLGFHAAAENFGITVVPTSLMNEVRQVELLRDFKVDVLLCTPSAMATLAYAAELQGIPFSDFPLSIAICGGEAYSEAMRQKLLSLWDVEIFDTYGLSEVIGPGVAHECHFHQGLHVMEDVFIPEIVDFETGISVPDGEEGELVVTALTKEAMPILRYRTNDRTRLISEPCACGLKFRRIQRLGGRRDEMFFLGENVLQPTDLEGIFFQFEEILPHYQLHYCRDSATLRVELAVRPKLLEDSSRERSLEEKIIAEIKKQWGAVVQVELVDFSALPLSLGKAERIVFI